MEFWASEEQRNRFYGLAAAALFPRRGTPQSHAEALVGPFLESQRQRAVAEYACRYWREHNRLPMGLHKVAYLRYAAVPNEPDWEAQPDSFDATYPECTAL
jgi:hypothetical protein